MARLFGGEREHKTTEVTQLLQEYEFGLREVEVAEILGWERRTANNYLHELETQGRAYKEGRLWYAEE
jgi:Mn-dependent DtxR family transcriptional regulator